MWSNLVWGIWGVHLHVGCILVLIKFDQQWARQTNMDPWPLHRRILWRRACIRTVHVLAIAHLSMFVRWVSWWILIGSWLPVDGCTGVLLILSLFNFLYNLAASFRPDHGAVPHDRFAGYIVHSGTILQEDAGGLNRELPFYIPWNNHGSGQKAPERLFFYYKQMALHFHVNDSLGGYCHS